MYTVYIYQRHLWGKNSKQAYRKVEIPFVPTIGLKISRPGIDSGIDEEDAIEELIYDVDTGDFTAFLEEFKWSDNEEPTMESIGEGWEEYDE